MTPFTQKLTPLEYYIACCEWRNAPTYINVATNFISPLGDQYLVQVGWGASSTFCGLSGYRITPDNSLLYNDATAHQSNIKLDTSAGAGLTINVNFAMLCTVPANGQACNLTLNYGTQSNP